MGAVRTSSVASARAVGNEVFLAGVFTRPEEPCRIARPAGPRARIALRPPQGGTTTSRAGVAG